VDAPIILCGLGKLGARVLEYLHTAGLPVVVVDTCCQPDDSRLLGARLVRGDIRERAILEQAGARHARAVLILTSDDLVNISATLMVRHLNGDVRIVVRLFNAVLIARLGKAVTNVFALSTSALTAPLLALTALSGDTLGAFMLEEGRRQVVHVTVSAGSTLVGEPVGSIARQHSATVVAHFPVSGEKRLLLDVDSAAHLAVGDQLVVCGAPGDVESLLMPGGDFALPTIRWLAWLRRNARMALRTLAEIDRAVLICTTVLLAVVFGSTLVYRFLIYGEQRSFADALYRTISVMATGAEMGEGEIRGWQKVFVSGLRIFGAAVVAAFTAFVTNFLLRARLGWVLEIRRIPEAGHVLVCGLGNLGFRIVEELLRAGERVVVIECAQDSRFLASARRLGVPVIVSDAAVLEVLRQANAATARAVIAAVNSDLANLEIALLVRELNPKQRVVVRLSQPALAQTLREAANIRLAMSIPALAAPAFVAALFGDRVSSLFLVGGQQLAVIELAVQPGDIFLTGKSVRALTQDYRMLMLSLARGERSVALPSGEDRFRSGDRLTFITALSDLDRLLRREPLMDGGTKRADRGEPAAPAQRA